MTKHTRTAPPVPLPADGLYIPRLRNRAQRKANALLDQAAPLRYVPSMGKRLKAAEGRSESARKAAHEALIAWNKP